MLGTTTPVGLHDFVVEQVVPKYAKPGDRAIDLGAGSGLLATRLRSFGLDVLAVDWNDKFYGADIPFLRVDLNQPDFAEVCGPESFQLVTATEVIEHMESPIGFLRNIGRLLAPNGCAVITTPNVDNLPARLKFLAKGTIRTMDETGEPTHISPIFMDLFRRQFLPRSGLSVRDHFLIPPGGYHFTRRRYAWALRLLSRSLPGDHLAGDNHILVLEKARSAQ
jgi:2-polyprenyl-3-methyl-5-hydroxy-6-metoxy-1,4-benzoquinol methylase